MIKFKNRSILIIFFCLLYTSSCDPWIDEEINIDPNNPLEVNVSQVLTSTEVGWAYLRGGDLGRYNSVFTQHHGGTDRQHVAFDAYNINEVDVNNSWETTYSTIMQELSIIIDESQDEETPSPHYAGVAKTLLADVLMLTTDLYGDIPYSDALNPESLNPAYDTQEQIYGTIHELLNSALVDFDAENSTFEPGAEDVIYGGDLAQWTKFNRFLKAKAFLHLGKLDAANYSLALEQIDAGSFVSNDDDAEVTFLASATGNHPLKQFMEQRGDLRMGEFFINLMKNTNDPRLAIYSDGEVGSPAGKPNTAASEPLYYVGETSYVPLGTYAELKFIEAEASFMMGNLLRAAAAHNAAVQASLAKVGATDAAAFIAANASYTEANITLEAIMTQKYVANYMNPETFTDWRRTGLPNFPPALGQSDIIRRWPYPQSERLYNAENFPGNKNIFTDRVWWDK